MNCKIQNKMGCYKSTAIWDYQSGFFEEFYTSFNFHFPFLKKYRETKAWKE